MFVFLHHSLFFFLSFTFFLSFYPTFFLFLSLSFFQTLQDVLLRFCSLSFSFFVVFAFIYYSLSLSLFSFFPSSSISLAPFPFVTATAKQHYYELICFFQHEIICTIDSPQTRTEHRICSRISRLKSTEIVDAGRLRCQ